MSEEEKIDFKTEEEALEWWEKVKLVEQRLWKLDDLETGQKVIHQYMDILLKQVNRIENRFYGLVFFLVIYLVLLSSLIYFD